ncbi:spike base protein, RCAP_Rcc01079 family [Celeribacter sp. SCSIO 80788]|uniref:spike base protein, RCAP_Rcc01079 family n=1 Tax=Celeribacter sp. SCSIO 80788 TaxID=3117013 RepID=UPI003DA26F93
MADEWAGRGKSINSPADNAEAVTPNDSADLSNASRALLLDAAGTVTVDMVGSGSNIALPLQEGYNPVRVTRVYATGTDAVTIVSLW